MKTPHESSWTPLLWAMKLLARAKADQKISIEPPSYTNLLASFEKVENVNRKLLRYSWINFPLAYTQVRYISTICIITHNLCFILLFLILYQICLYSSRSQTLLCLHILLPHYSAVNISFLVQMTPAFTLFFPTQQLLMIQILPSISTPQI